MANEITLSIRIEYEQGGISEQFTPAELLNIDVLNPRYVKHSQLVDNAEEALLLPADVGTGGYFAAVNRDATSYVDIQAATGETALVRLKPGEACCFRLAPGSTAPYVISDGEDVRLEYILIGP